MGIIAEDVMIAIQAADVLKDILETDLENLYAEKATFLEAYDQVKNSENQYELEKIHYYSDELDRIERLIYKLRGIPYPERPRGSGPTLYFSPARKK